MVVIILAVELVGHPAGGDTAPQNSSKAAWMV